jgi:hypothetical protein
MMRNDTELKCAGAAVQNKTQTAARTVPVRSLVLGVGLAVLAGCGEPTPPAADDGWLMLLDGTSLTYWDIVGDANWHIDDGRAMADQSTAASFLVSKQAYSDFELELEFWVNSEANSGIFVRCEDPAAPSDTSCYEVNIFDTRPDQAYRTGSIVNLAAPEQFVYTGGQWNRFMITAQGSRLQVVLNGRDMVDVEDSRLTSGPIALQYGPVQSGTGVVRFRNVKLRPL